MNLNNKIVIAIPKGRIIKEVFPILKKINLIPSPSFFDKNDRKLMFNTNVENIKIIRVRSFDVATFLIYGAAHMAIVGSDVLDEFNNSQIYSPIDLNVGLCRLVVATEEQKFKKEDSREWSYVRVATKYPNLTKKYFEEKGVHAECIKLNGAMELAPSMGLCSRIVDLVDTGKTLKVNGLREIEEIIKVSTRIAINKVAYKTNFGEINKVVEKFENYLREKM